MLNIVRMFDETKIYIIMDSLQLKEIVGYLPYGLEVEYQGITNLKELSEHNSKEPKTFDIFDEEHEKWAISEPKAVIGRKVSKLKQIKFYKNNISVHVGTYHGYLKTVYLSDIKPILYPLSMLTKEIEHKGEKIIPIIYLFNVSNGDNYNKELNFEWIKSWGDVDILKVHHYTKGEFTEFIYHDLNFRKEVFYEKDSYRFGMNLPHAIICNSVIKNQNKLNQLLLEWNFDIHNLIHRGLAVAKGQ